MEGSNRQGQGMEKRRWKADWKADWTGGETRVSLWLPLSAWLFHWLPLRPPLWLLDTRCLLLAAIAPLPPGFTLFSVGGKTSVSLWLPLSVSSSAPLSLSRALLSASVSASVCFCLFQRLSRWRSSVASRRLSHWLFFTGILSCTLALSHFL